MQQSSSLKIGLAQIAPVWLDREASTAKIAHWVTQAAAQGCQLVVFGEALLPGYPFWLERTDAARFNSPLQKALHAHYLDQAVQIEAGHLDGLCDLAEQHRIAIYLGCIERAADRGGHSAYCSLLYIDAEGVIQSVHRKLMPTYEERLCWSIGDGHGLRVHALGGFTLGGLNCWENWMPLARAALYAQGENLHVAVWPGGEHNTRDISRFIAQESRSYVVSVSGLLRPEDIPSHLPHAQALQDACGGQTLANGGSCIAAPDGSWLLEPVCHQEGLFSAELSLDAVYQARQNFDPSGHYARPDVTRLSVNRQRQGVVEFKD